MARAPKKISVPASTDVPRSERSGCQLEQALKRWHSLSVIDAAAITVSGLQNGDGLEAGAAVASGIPHAADGLVRTALSPIQSAADAGELGSNGILPDVDSLRIPVQYRRTC